MKRWSDPRIEAMRSRLDGISADIGSLEKYLSGSAVRTSVFVPVPDAPGEHIGWDLGQPGQWRIVHVDRAGNRRMLIETKAEVRLHARSALRPLLKAVGDELDMVRLVTE